MKKLLILLVFFGLVSAQDKYEYHKIQPTSEMLTPSLNIYASYGWEFVQETRIVVQIPGTIKRQAHQVILKREYSRDYDWTKKRILKDSHIRELAQIVDDLYWVGTEKEMADKSTFEKDGNIIFSQTIEEYMANYFGIVYDPKWRDIPHWSDPKRQKKELDVYEQEAIKEFKERQKLIDSDKILKEKADMIKDNSNQ